MEPLNAAAIPEGSRLLVDSAPIILVLEGHARLAPRFLPVFERHAAGKVTLAVATTTVSEVLTGLIRTDNETPAARRALPHRVIFSSPPI